MKRIFTIILLIALTGTTQLFAQKTITVNASNADISDNLDLEAVAYLFGEAKNLEEFEQTINDPKKRISNLDLNRDGYVDYLRVIETSDDGVYVIIIQAVLGEDIFQDVATIDVDTRDRNNVRIQVVGNEYIYGVNYIFEPVYMHRPYICDFFWYPHHTVWYSPYYWGYYPVHYHYRKPHRIHVYHNHVHSHYRHLDCRYVPTRTVNVHVHHDYHRNDFEKKHPEQAFNRRNSDVENRRELVTRRSSSPNVQSTRSYKTNTETKSRKVDNNWNDNSGNRRSESSNRRSVTVEQPSTKSVSVNKESSKPRKEYRSSESNERRNSSNNNNKKEYSKSNAEQKSAPSVSSRKPTETKSTKASNSSSERKSTTVSKPRNDSKPAVQSNSNRSSSNKSSNSTAKPQRSSNSNTSAPKSRNTSSGSSYKPADKSKSTNRR